MANTVDADLVKRISVEVSQLSQGAKRLEANQKEEADRVINALQSVQQAIDKKLENIERDVKGLGERVESLESEIRNRSGCLSVLISQGQSSLLSERNGGAPGIFDHLKTRHNAVLETSCSKLPLDREMLVRDNVLKICKEKKHTQITTKEKQEVITYETDADVQYAFEELGIDIANVKTSYITDLNLKAKEISEDDAVTAYLKQAARKSLKTNSRRIHSIIPYHYQRQTAVVIYTYNPTPDLVKQEWSKNFLGFSVFIVNLMYGYATTPPILPKPYPTSSPEEKKQYSKIKDDVTKLLAKKHSNLSTICVNFKIQGNQLVQGELCVQIGVLTKGIVPLGEEEIESDMVPVDIVESSATICAQLPMLKKIWPVNLGVGVGVEGGDTTGSLGAVVKHNDSGKLFILSNAHVLLGTSSFIVQPSKQDFEEMKDEANKRKAKWKEKCEKLSEKINMKRVCGEEVQKLEENLEDYTEELQDSEKQLRKIDKNHSPRKIGQCQPEDIHISEELLKNHKLDAAIALIEPDEFEPEGITKMYAWPNDLKNEDGTIVKEIELNGNFMTENNLELELSSHSVVFKCGRTTGVTKGTLCCEIAVKLGGGDDFIPTSSSNECFFPSETSKPSSNATSNEGIWHNILHIKSTTERKTGEKSFSAGGDSGAVVFDEEGTCVGLLFGRIDSQVHPLGGGLATPIHKVFDTLNITLATPDDLEFYKETLRTCSPGPLEVAFCI